MNIRKFVPILLAVALIAFGVGFLSLRYNDNYKFTNSKSGNLLNIKSKDEIVKIGTDGIEVRDKDDHVSIGWNGIKISDGDEEIRIGWNGIKINDKDKVSYRIGNDWNWFDINPKNVKWETINEEKFAEIKNIDTINISSPFIDIKVIPEDRDNVQINYYGKMKTNVVPILEVENISNKLNIKLEISSNNYSVVESDVILKVFVPKSFKGDFNTNTSSGDIYIKNLVGNNINISSSSGDLELENLEGKSLNLSTSSGDMKLDGLIGEIIIASSSGDISLNSKKLSEDMKISTSSGDISIKLSDDASYNIKGSTSSGDFNSSIDMNIKENEKGRFIATIGSGEKSINISTSSGDIEFK
ncbi:DUF4097 and DUF4098 domain-containing protein YvlB [Tissierella praeacuta DSM 18095]|uniref:DUF4097 and DUF4098 domain-containing protein YvlB n=1 Tax=Tissierella praeacuta DSM 18095 TaxID=1123404 RepID=A0A1M4W0N8_9FIRM|nr:DUF4097 family beta strand repeat-containing protein [Tissierella praeacuta]SHE74700.1 DUF4097 and DUF4098 domain-containing protein YvlB [Tissierella praeacuta DSM 18095]SUP00233.1 Uncharacterised protein [Tissierella praeacuta]